MARNRLRVALDANVLVAGVRVPRWPYEVMRAVLGSQFQLVLPDAVIAEARRHLAGPDQAEALETFIRLANPKPVSQPPADLVDRNLDLVRSRKDVPIALALLAGETNIFVTNDRDFTEPDATASRLREGVLIMLPAVFLRDVCGWRSDDLEKIRTRTWEDLPAPNGE